MLFAMSEVDLKKRATYPVWTQDLVRYVDLDPNEHVNNGAINAYFQDGRVRFRVEHMSGVGLELLEGFVVVRSAIEFLAPLHFPATVDVGTVVLRIGRSSYTLGQGIFYDERCIATAEIVTVKVDPGTGRSIPLADEIRSVLREVSVRT